MPGDTTLYASAPVFIKGTNDAALLDAISVPDFTGADDATLDLMMELDLSDANV